MQDHAEIVRRGGQPASQPAGQSATRVSLLDAAERLFAERGIASVSLRVITADVGANVAAINYHFGSKERLIEDVFARRARAIAEERLRLLESALADRDRDRDPDPGTLIERLVLAFVEPGFSGGAGSGEAGALYARFRARMMIEASDLARSLMADHFNESSVRFLAAFRDALPHLDQAEVEWRFHAMLSVMVYTMADPGRIQALTGGACDPADVGAALEHLVPAVAGMFRAPSGAPANTPAVMEEMGK